MFERFKRILMIAADGSPGGGTPVAAGAPPEPPAQGAKPAIDDATKESFIKQGRDAAYAELRRSGALKRSYMNGVEGKEGKDGEGGKKPSERSGGNDLQSLRRLDRAITNSGRKVGEKAYERLERDFADESPEDAETWLKKYFEDLGSAPPATGDPAAAQAGGTPAGTPPKNVAERPITDRGAPAPAKTSVDELYLPTASPEDRKAFIDKKGLVAYRDTLNAQLTGKRVQLK